MAQGVAYGTSSVDKFVRFFRIKSDHTMIQQPVSVGDSEFADIDDAEFASKIVGDISVTPQDDGSHQFQMNVAAWGAELLDFLDTYKNPSAAGEKTEFTAFHGETFGGDGDSGTNDQLVMVIHAAADPDTSKGIVLAAICNIDVANTGGFTIQPNDVKQVQLTVTQVKPKTDVTIHNAAGTKSVLNDTYVDFTTENADIDIAEGSYKIHYPVALD